MSIDQDLDMPRQKRTHRGRRSRGKGPKPDHMAVANEHIQSAHKDPTPHGTTAHLFKALSALKKAKGQSPESDES